VTGSVTQCAQRLSSHIQLDPGWIWHVSPGARNGRIRLPSYPGVLAPFGYLCTRTHVCICIYIYMYIYVYAHICTFIRIYICTHMIHTHALLIDMYLYICYLNTYIHRYVYICTFTHTYLHINTYIAIHRWVHGVLRIYAQVWYGVWPMHYAYAYALGASKETDLWEVCNRCASSSGGASACRADARVMPPATCNA